MKKFLNHFFDFDSDNGPFSKALSYILVLGMFVAVAVLILSSYGVWNNDMSKAAHHAPGYDKVIGSALLAFSAVWAYLNFSDTIKFQVSALAFDLVLLASLILGFCFNCGYIF
jgi:hypothetical protein